MSDPGYGHASRAIALIRELRRLSPKLSISVRTLMPASYIQNSLVPLAVEVTESVNDLILKFDAGLYCDVNYAYKENIERFSSKLGRILHEERRFFKKTRVDLIVSDIPAYPFYLASEMGIPSVAVASFLWSWFLQELLDASDPQVRDAVEKMNGFYKLATESFALPFSCDLSSLGNIQEVSLLVRKISRSPREIRKTLGYKESDFVVFLTGGYTLPWPVITRKLPTILSESSKLKLVLSSNASISDSDNVKKIPQSDMETQDYVAASDLVVSKPGHSIISEATAYRVPLILTLPTKHPEWESNLNWVVSESLAKFIPFDEFETFSWLKSVEEIGEILKDQSSNQLAWSGNGSLEIASALIEGYDLK